MSNLTCLITGSKGFIGTHLTRYLTEQGHHVIGFDRGDSLPNGSSHTSIDYIFHLAGEKNPRKVSDDPSTISKIDLSLTEQVLDFAKNHSVKKTILISTLGVYGTDGLLSESTTPKATTPYTDIKLAIEQKGIHAFNQHDTGVAIARLSNIYGSHQSTEAVIASLIEQMHTGDTIRTGNTNSIREFLHVDDMCAALLALATTPKTSGQIFNVGSGIGTSIDTLIDLIKTHSHYTGTIEKDPEKVRPNEIPVQIADISKIKAFTGWEPRIKLDEGIMKTVQFFQQHTDRGNT